MSDELLRSPPPKAGDFTVGIICALGLEAGSVEEMLDRKWHNTEDMFTRLESDKHEYTLGDVGSSHVALIWQMKPYGKTMAALAAAALRNSFPMIKYVLVVGVCGGMPKNVKGEEILLGDVIVGTALHKYDEGHQHTHTYVTGSKCEVGRNIEPFLNKLNNSKSYNSYLKKRCADFHKKLSLPKDSEAIYRGWAEDRLYKANDPHEDINKSCAELKCGEGGDNCVPRERLTRMEKALQKNQGEKLDTSPAIHFGPVGSGDTVMKSAVDRDRIAKAEKIIAFEMEGAG
jgi:nucleoside phosphorylase